MDQDDLLSEYASTWRAGLSHPDGRLGAGFDVTLRRPLLARALMPLADYMRYWSALPPRAKELVVLVVAADRRCGFVWERHVGPAARAGWSEPDIAALGSGEPPVFRDVEDEVTYDVARELLVGGHLDDALFARAIAALGEARVVDTIGMTTHYWQLTALINAATPDAERGGEDTIPERTRRPR